MRSQQTELSGWGRTAPTVATLVDLAPDDVPAAVTAARCARGAIARGLGRAYGDPAQNAGGVVLRLEPDVDSIVLDEAAGTVTAGGGVSFDTLLRELVPQGWFVPVTPGTRYITVGGAIASDIHGKNHHVDGTFGAHVVAFDLLLADGSLRTVTRDGEPDLWVATLGGMGLTGLIVTASFRMLPIETSRCLVETERAADLDALIERMETGDDDHRYSVAWVDLVTRGTHLGRSVLTRGDHATLSDLHRHDRRAAGAPLHYEPGSLAAVPAHVPNVLTRASVRAFNEFWYRKAPARRLGVETITGYFHPLDMVGDWNRLYGRYGFLQYQFVVPFAAVDTLRSIVVEVVESGHASFLAVLKRFGPEGEGLLSFPTPGWTLTLDLPAGAAGIGDLLARLDDRVLDAGGRHYLAKDATTTPKVIRAGYPRFAEWQAIRDRYDPDGVWASDQARRLELVQRW